MRFFHFGRNICFLVETIFPSEEKKETRKINHGNDEKKVFCVQ